ncbi:hypothetical protein [Embleya sp. MST-111070]|uniref:hypothetical protein n=1 Tax=Embleya sp. MST-111070 TaxID=3398231 RepID=UPI003F7410E2
MTPPPGHGKSMRPLVAAWKQTFHMACAGSPLYAKGLALHGAKAVKHVQGVPGRIHATVTTKKGTAHRAHITLPLLSNEQWQHLADRLAGDPHASADLLAGKVPALIADPGHAGGATVVPLAQQLGFACSCSPQRRRLCDHSAALGHAIAEHLGTSPSILLTARGMPTRSLADVLRARLAAQRLPHLPADQHGTVRADHTHTLWANRLDVTATEPSLDDPAFVAAPLTDPPEPAPAADDLARMIRDAANHAQAVLDYDAPRDPHDALADTVRLLAGPNGLTRLTEIASRTGHAEPELRRLLIAYRHAGPAGVHAARGPAPTPPDVLTAALDTIRRTGPASLGELRVTDGRLTDTGIQLRYGLDGHWHPFTLWNEQWQPRPGHSPDPTTAYRAARRARPTRT